MSEKGPLKPLRQRWTPSPGRARKEGANILFEIVTDNEEVQYSLGLLDADRIRNVLIATLRRTRRILSSVQNLTRVEIRNTMQEVLLERIQAEKPAAFQSWGQDYVYEKSASETPTETEVLAILSRNKIGSRTLLLRRALVLALTGGLAWAALHNKKMPSAQKSLIHVTSEQEELVVGAGDLEAEPTIHDDAGKEDSTNSAGLKQVKDYYGARLRWLIKEHHEDNVCQNPEKFGYIGASGLAMLNAEVEIPLKSEVEKFEKKGIPKKRWYLGSILDESLKKAGMKRARDRRRQVAILEYTIASIGASSPEAINQIDINRIPGGSKVEIANGKLTIKYPDDTIRISPLRWDEYLGNRQ